MKKNDQLEQLNEKLQEHQDATIRTSDDLDIKRSESGEGNETSSRSPSAKLVQQRHSDKQATSSRTAFNHAHAPVKTTAKPKPQMPVLRPMAPKPLLQPLKPLAPMKPLMPAKPKI